MAKRIEVAGNDMDRSGVRATRLGPRGVDGSEQPEGRREEGTENLGGVESEGFHGCQASNQMCYSVSSLLLVFRGRGEWDSPS